MADTNTPAGKKQNAASAKSAAGPNAAMLTLVILLCLASCGLILMLNPHTIQVDSVYQGF
jgi:hypothetical protein